MTYTNPVDNNALAEEAKASKHKETYKLMEKTQVYRIGVGARTDITDAPSFFVEVLISLSPKSDEVNLPHLGKVVSCLKVLQTRGYLLAYEGNNVSCEKKNLQDLNEEYLAVKTLLKTAFT